MKNLFFSLMLFASVVLNVEGQFASYERTPLTTNKVGVLITNVTFQGYFAGSPVVIGTNIASPFTHGFTNSPDGVLHEQHTTDGSTWVDDYTVDMSGVLRIASIIAISPGTLNINLGSGSISGSQVNVGQAIVTDGSQIGQLNAGNITSGTVPPANLPVATTSAFGAMKPDGTTITSAGGVMSAVGGGGISTFGSTIFSDWTIGSSTTALAGYPSTPAQAAGGTFIDVNTDFKSILYNNPAVASGTNYLEDNQQGVYTGYSGFVEFVFAITNTTSCNYRVGLLHENDAASNFATNNAPTTDAFDAVWIDSGLVNFALETCNGSGITTNISSIAITTALNTLTVVRLTCNVSNVVMSVNGVPAATNSTSVMTNVAGKIFTMKTYDSTAKGFKMYHASYVWNY